MAWWWLVGVEGDCKAGGWMAIEQLRFVVPLRCPRCRWPSIVRTLCSNGGMSNRCWLALGQAGWIPPIRTVDPTANGVALSCDVITTEWETFLSAHATIIHQ